MLQRKATRRCPRVENASGARSQSCHGRFSRTDAECISAAGAPGLITVLICWRCHYSAVPSTTAAVALCRAGEYASPVEQGGVLSTTRGRFEASSRKSAPQRPGLKAAIWGYVFAARRDSLGAMLADAAAARSAPRSSARRSRSRSSSTDARRACCRVFRTVKCCRDAMMESMVVNPTQRAPSPDASHALTARCHAGRRRRPAFSLKWCRHACVCPRCREGRFVGDDRCRTDLRERRGAPSRAPPFTAGSPRTATPRFTQKAVSTRVGT